MRKFKLKDCAVVNAVVFQPMDSDNLVVNLSRLPNEDKVEHNEIF